ncbi:HU family DNA-binding protein [Granulicoccus sp. GXG6511]|uniref:HU family DNA-binding protein n=1 Tax=Granulicoccus sp. GXG6511 TaxID=3381351 RepID=UPI003D7C9B91
MNKAELIEALSVHFGGNKAEAARMLNIVVETIIQETARTGKVGITGFGVFETIAREERVVRNPRTGERKTAEATTIVRFRPGSDLKAYVAGEKPVPPPPSTVRDVRGPRKKR